MLKSLRALSFIMLFSVMCNNVWSVNITSTIRKQESILNANIGVAVYDIKKKSFWDYNSKRRFPVLSTFKTLLCANVLYNVDKKKMSLDDEVFVSKKSVQGIAYKPILKDKVEQTMTIGQLCDAIMTYSDNAATNLVLDAVGGPKELTKFIKRMGHSVKITAYEPAVNNYKASSAANTVQVKEMARLLYTLLYTSKLSTSSRIQLLGWMKANTTSQYFRKKLVPKGYVFADRTGAGKGSRAINIVLSGKKHLIITVYIAGSNKSRKLQDEAIIAIVKKAYAKFKVY